MKKIKEILNHKGIFPLCALSFSVLVSLVPLLFTGDNMNAEKISIYLFSNHPRFPENIAYDLAEFVSIVVFIGTIWILVPYRKYKRFVACFFWVSILNVLGYFLFYSHLVSILLIPVLIILLLLTYYINYKNGHEKRSDVG